MITCRHPFLCKNTRQCWKCTSSSQYESCHEIMAFFFLRKLILQMLMCSYPVGLDVWFLVRPFIYFHTLSVRTVKAPLKMSRCTGSPEPSLVAYVINAIISWAGSYVKDRVLAKILKIGVKLLSSRKSWVLLLSSVEAPNLDSVKDEQCLNFVFKSFSKFFMLKLSYQIITILLTAEFCTQIILISSNYILCEKKKRR